MLQFAVTVEPASEPLEIDEAKLHLKVDHEDENARIALLVTTARQMVEEHLGRALIQQTIRYRRDGFPCDVLRLPRPPLVSVSSITYVDLAGATQTWSSSAYQVDDGDGEVARVAPVYGGFWPTTRPQMNAVTVTYVAGWANAAAVPRQIRQALLLLVHDLYRAGGEYVTGTIVAKLPTTVDALLEPYRVRFLP